MSEEIRNCPFCGNANIEIHHNGEWLACPKCNADGPINSTAKWNTRPIEDALRARVAELEAQLAEAQQAREWIPVSERLPEKYGPYLINRRKVIQKATFFPDVPEYWEADGVTHWMPLPTPPESQP